MKTIKLINNRLSWLSAGIALGIWLVAWAETDKENKAKSDPYNFSNYKHNHYKENTNA